MLFPASHCPGEDIRVSFQGDDWAGAVVCLLDLASRVVCWPEIGHGCCHDERINVLGFGLDRCLEFGSGLHLLHGDPLIVCRRDDIGRPSDEVDSRSSCCGSLSQGNSLSAG